MGPGGLCRKYDQGRDIMIERLRERLKELENDRNVFQAVYEQANATMRQAATDILRVEGAINLLKQLIGEVEENGKG